MYIWKRKITGFQGLGFRGKVCGGGGGTFSAKIPLYYMVFSMEHNWLLSSAELNFIFDS